MEQITTVGIDLAKRVFALHGVDGVGRVVLRRTVRREELVEVVSGLSPCLIGMEAGSGAHDWARRFKAFGHTVRLIAAKFVTPYRRSAKNDGNDAEAICEAVSRPGMRFVPIKSAEQQAVLTLHRVRQGFVDGAHLDHQSAPRVARGVRRGAAAAHRDRPPPGRRRLRRCRRSHVERSRISARICACSMRGCCL